MLYTLRFEVGEVWNDAKHGAVRGRACLLLCCLLLQERVSQLHHLANQRRHLGLVVVAQLLQGAALLGRGLCRRGGGPPCLRPTINS